MTLTKSLDNGDHIRLSFYDLPYTQQDDHEGHEVLEELEEEDVKPIVFAFHTKAQLILLRFARTLAAALNKQVHDVLPKSRMIYLFLDICENDEAKLDHMILNEFDTLYRYLFVGVHYIIERSWFNIQQRMNDTSLGLLQLIGDENSLIHFVALCNLNWHRLRLESGVVFANDQALKQFGTDQEEQLLYYDGRSGFRPLINSTEEYVISIPSTYEGLADSNVWKCNREVPKWLFVTLIHQAMRRDWNVETLTNPSGHDIDISRLDDVSRWSGWMDAAVYNSATLAYSKIENSVATFSSVMDAVARADSSMLLFANLTGVTYHLLQFQQKLYKRRPVVEWLLYQQGQLVSMLKV
jgi:hypothetical protein